MSFLQLPVSSFDHPILCYQGSFDPPHRGHISSLQAAMNKISAAAAVVIVCNGENEEKPNRSSWEHRTNMARSCFAHLENVYVSELPDKESKALLLKDRYVFTLVGSDSWPRYSQRPRIPFNGICVSLRDGEFRSEDQTEIQGKPVFFVTPELQKISSSKIRSLCTLTPQVYDESGLIPSEFAELLIPQTLNYIQTTKLYKPTQAQRFECIKNTIKDFMKARSFIDPSFELDFFSGHNFSSIDARGKSGDLTLIAKEKTNATIFVKAYITPSHKKNFQLESDGIQTFKSLSLLRCKVPEIHWQKSYTGFSHIGFSYIDMPDLAFLFSQAITSEGIDRFYRSCFCIGRSLAELHHARIDPISLDALNEKIEVLNQRSLGRLNKLPSNLREQFSPIYQESYLKFLQNPGYHTYVHGDASLSNFLCDVDKEEVFVVDLESFSKAKSHDGSPSGIPAEDYHRFLGDMVWLNTIEPIEEETLLSAQLAFESGYSTMDSIITPEAHDYFKNYWILRNKMIKTQLLSNVDESNAL
ncbi:MAG: hypothetical protein FJZ57_06755 [Chlamydiae bacterium]|nr:hypothetical protein [Chlamydiota bacterium]